MKKIIVALLCALCAVLMISCGGSDEEKQEETTLKTDWRNTIEYESAFFVNEQLRVLYALDKGSITLWDNGGNGETLQVIEYDTTVSNAIERIEKEDFNGDGNCDIRIIYSEGEEGTRYTLWLWSTRTERFAECKLYSEIYDPVVNSESGNIVDTRDTGLFGVVTKEYAFNETSGLDLVSVTISDPEKVAGDIAAGTVGGTVRKSDGKASVDGVECSVYIAEGGAEKAYICHTPDSVWYVDAGCLGLYRAVSEKDGKPVFGDYAESAGGAEDIANKLGEGFDRFTAASHGSINGSSASLYEARYLDGSLLYLINDEKGYWYASEDGALYRQISASSGETVGEEEYEFALPSAEE